MSGMSGTEDQAKGGRIRHAVLIAGPTASGKSALALTLAAETGGIIVNADAIQVYAGLEVLTARPGPAELAHAPHLLYGHVDPAIAYSAALWLRDVERLAASGAFENRAAIFVGGTGLYLRALTQGLSEMPAVPAAVRRRWRERLAVEGAPALHERLAALDPPAAARLRPGDGQRIVRALEVFDASGRSIVAWQAQPSEPLVEAKTATRLIIEADRGALIDRIDRRFEAMMAAGALAEAAALAARGLDPDLPAMKAIGLRELQSAIANMITVEAAIERAKTATRQYAKRQATWFRHQFGPEWRRVSLDRAASRTLSGARPAGSETDPENDADCVFRLRD